MKQKENTVYAGKLKTNRKQKFLRKSGSISGRTEKDLSHGLTDICSACRCRSQ